MACPFLVAHVILSYELGEIIEVSLAFPFFGREADINTLKGKESPAYLPVNDSTKHASSFLCFVTLKKKVLTYWCYNQSVTTCEVRSLLNRFCFCQISLNGDLRHLKI